MCGFAGFAGPVGIHPDEMKPVLARMGEAMAYRGPDDAGDFIDAEAGIGLVHRRLAIIDLSPAGHQPMHSSCGRFVLVYNGEIYNFRELRDELSSHGHVFRGDSDSEVLVEAISRWGVPDTLNRSIGMFAFALWDRERRELTLGRDRFGIKPLFYAVRGRGCVFASELKALRSLPGRRPPIDRVALAEFMDRGYVSAPRSIYEGVAKLLPGSLLRFGPEHGNAATETWWSLQDTVDTAAGEPLDDPDAAAEIFTATLRDAVRQRLVADVPLGAFLSGGIDSTLVVATMQQEASGPVKTFTVGFDDDRHDEATHAARIAAFLGTDHTERRFEGRELLETVARMPDVFDEPFADASQLPTLLLAAAAREQVTVALSGDGGDESFAGYVRHQQAEPIARVRRAVPGPLRRLLGAGLEAAGEARLQGAWERLGFLLPERLQPTLPGNKLVKLGRVLGADDASQAYRAALGCWPGPLPVIGAGGAEETAWWRWPERALSVAESYMYRDTLGYLPDDVLTKVDRCTMAVSLEARVPLLDHRLVGLAWRLSLAQKLRGTEGKILPKKILGALVPDSLWNRPKMGFAPPIGAWLRGELREWADELLAPGMLQNQGYLDAARVARVWSDHRAGRRPAADAIWHVLMFQAWLANDV